MGQQGPAYGEGMSAHCLLLPPLPAKPRAGEFRLDAGIHRSHEDGRFDAGGGCGLDPLSSVHDNDL